MPSFDIVSEVDQHEVRNTVDHCAREIGTRFDFKGVNAEFRLENDNIVLAAESDFQLKQMLDILIQKAVKRGIDASALSPESPQLNLSQVKQVVKVQQGIDSDLSKKIVKAIKETKVKVQAAIQGDKVRVTGKKRDDLQKTIQFLKENDWNQPLQYENFRD